MHTFLTVLCLSLLLTGCITLPPPEGQTSSASYVGDSASVHVTEVVVSVPLDQKADEFRNLHVSLSALLNAEKVSTADRYDVERIIRRSRTRLSADIAKDLTVRGPIKVADLAALRAALEAKAQAAFDSVFSKWTRADVFKVEIVVTSIFFTDGSVGRTEESQRLWW